MNAVILGFDVVLQTLRVVAFAAGVATALVALLSFLVRTRRLSPFGPVARFVRGSVDPLLAPVERRVVRAGGQPATAPWWALAAVVGGAIILLSLLGFVRNQLLGAAYAMGAGPRGIFAMFIGWTFALLRIALLVRVVSSWFQISPYSRWVRWAFPLTDWLLRPLRQIIPPLGMIDISPIVAYFALSLLEGLLLRAI